ncbi:hypothetical protein [Streptomyces sp. NPDC002962]|uniref:hypothetical protein n=1 Tax=Streptomyces sp. NPDC002962 TaxID=3364674 RepID=UPI0036AA19CB
MGPLAFASRRRISSGRAARGRWREHPTGRPCTADVRGAPVLALGGFAISAGLGRTAPLPVGAAVVLSGLAGLILAARRVDGRTGGPVGERAGGRADGRASGTTDHGAAQDRVPAG